MSYTIVTSPNFAMGLSAIRDVLQIRAVISTRTELQELIEKLTRRLETDFAQEENHEHDTAAAEPVRPSLPAPASANRAGSEAQETPSISDRAGR